MWLDEFVVCVASEGMEKEKTKNVATLLSMFLMHGDEVLADLVKEKLQDHGCAPNFRRIHRSVVRSEFVAPGCTPCLNGDMEKRNFTRDRPELWNQAQHVLFVSSLDQAEECETVFC